METRYEVRLVVLKDCETALDMTIGCENAQQLDKAKRVIDERLIDYIAMFAVEQGLTGNRPVLTKMAEPAPKPETVTPPPAEKNTAKEESIMAEKRTERTGTKGILKLHCKSCGDTFGAFLREPKTEYTCRCGNKISLDWLGRFEFDCPECGKHTFGKTNIEDAAIEFKCICGANHSLEWDSEAKAYTL